MIFRSLLLSTALSVCLPAAVAHGQDLSASLDDLLLVRHRPSAYRETLQAKGGWLAGFPDKVDTPNGLEFQNTLDGYVDFRHDSLFAPNSGLRAYGGRDGVYVMANQGDLRTEGKESRIEVYGRLWPFYREGFYRDGDFISTARYQGRDAGARLGFATVVAESLSLEISARYEHHQFDGSDVTPVGFVVPDDFNSYAGRATFEQNTLTLDRRTNWPIGGYVAALYGEWEGNDSNKFFGSLGRQTELPSNLLRAGAHLDAVFPANESDMVELTLTGQLHPKDDRIQIYDAQKPIGEWWAQGNLGYRWMWGDTCALTPGAILQWVRLPDEFGTETKNNFFFGGFARFRWQIGEAFNFLAEYSYLSNQSRPPIAINKDTSGESRVFVGFGIVLGTRAGR